MDAFLKAIEARGFKVPVGDGEKAGTRMELYGENVAVGLEEDVQRR